MVFTGHYEHAIDAKHRIAIPSDIRRKLQRELGRAGGDGDSSIVLYAVLAGEETIALYTEQGYERLAEELRHSGLEPEALLEYEDLFYAMSQQVELDKAGRARLPDHLLERTGLSGEVALTGAGDHLKVRDKVAWQAQLEAKLKDQPGVLVNPRLLIGRHKDRAGD